MIQLTKRVGRGRQHFGGDVLSIEDPTQKLQSSKQVLQATTLNCLSLRPRTSASCLIVNPNMYTYRLDICVGMHYLRAN